MAFPRGARPTPRHKLAAATPHRITGATLPQVIYAPKQLSYWLNNQYGDCVTAEEAFAKACQNPEIFIQDSTVKTWAGQNGLLNGADLTQVMDLMAKQGFSQDGHIYGDGPYTSVDYSNEAVLQNALTWGPVKIGIDANALPSGAGNGSGWYKFGGSPGEFSNEDHCIAICGCGSAAYLFGALGAPVPASAPTGILYAIFTWSGIGVVDHAWIMSTVGEAWLRNPTTIVNGTPLPEPGPGPTPPPPPPPPPVPPVPPIPPTPPAPPAPSWIVALLQWLINLFGGGVHSGSVSRPHQMLSGEPFGLVAGAGLFAVDWTKLIAYIKALLAQYGPAVVPILNAWIDALPVGPFVKLVLHALVNFLVSQLPPAPTPAH